MNFRDVVIKEHGLLNKENELLTEAQQLEDKARELVRQATILRYKAAGIAEERVFIWKKGD